MLRILVLAPGSNPNGTHGPLIGYSHGEALARLHAVTLVIRRENEEAVRRRQSPFRAIEVINLRWLDRIHAWCFRWIFRNNYAGQALTAFNYLFCLAFEWRAWRQTRTRIMAGDSTSCCVSCLFRRSCRVLSLSSFGEVLSPL